MDRAVDIVLACILIILALPFMAFVALAIKLDSPGPVTCRAEGVWLDGLRRMNLLKFRTTPYRAGSIARGVPWTRVGKYLYLTRIDELPQLFQALSGDLSIFGNRKHASAISKRRRG